MQRPLRAFLTTKMYITALLLLLGIIFTGIIILLFLSPSKPLKEVLDSTEFPFLNIKSTLALSIIVPCYNEQLRLEVMLNEVFEYLESKQIDAEIIVVDDASTDKTVNLAQRIQKRHKNLKILKLVKNRGKGGAVVQGIMHSRGELILFADADGATRFSDLDDLIRELDKVKKDGLGFAVGSRAHMVNSSAVVKRSFIRNILMKCEVSAHLGFHLAVYILGIQSINDTQCGFKLLTRDAALLIAPNMHVEGWIFDIEMFILAFKFQVPVVEVPVTWVNCIANGSMKLTDLRCV